jgi:hypothetical protein
LAPVAAVLCTLLLAACHSSDNLTIAADRAILDWSGTSAIDRNRGILPQGFTTPDEHSCATDPTRVFIGELFKTGLRDIQVENHWAPIISGPQAGKRTLSMPEISLAGTVHSVNDSTDDVLGDHPFGVDSNADITPDAPYTFQVFRGESVAPDALHTEVEQRIFPRAALGYSPQAGDRALQRGAWILDCGHPPYGSEMHPPTFLHYARAADAQTTIAAVAVMPYRSSQLFNPDPALAVDFANAARFDDANTRTFSRALVAAIFHAVNNNDDRLTSHALMIGNRFDKLDWLVCAPLPKPAGAVLDARYRLTARTGVNITATQYAASGCVRFVATMGSDYVPMALALKNADWPWDQLSASASGQLGQPIDVRQKIIDLLNNAGFDGTHTIALQPDHPPLIDAYPALQTRAGADQDGPTALDSRADDQPYPLYGRIHVGWK